MKKYLFSLLMLVLLSDTGYATVTVLSPNGSSEAKPNLALAVTAAVGKTIIVTTPQVIDDITIPSSTKLKVNKGGLITVNSGKTFTIKGAFEAGPYQVFAGSGRISGLVYVDPVWFEDTQEGNQRAFNAVSANGSLELTTIRNVKSIKVPVPMTIKGSGGLSQDFSAIGSDILVLAAGNTTVDGITLTGPVTTGNTNHTNVAGINCKGRSNITIRNCKITGKQNGIQSMEDPTPVTNIRIQNNTIMHAGYGIVIWPTGHPATTTNYGSNIAITGNDVRLQAGYETTSENIRGIRVSHCDDVTITGNNILGAQLSIETWCDNRNRWARNIEISTNTVDTWVCLDNFDGGTLSNNIIDYSLLPNIHAVSKHYGGVSGAVHGIESVYVRNIMIQGNYIANQPGNGIYIGYAGTTNSNELAISSNITIDNNKIYRCAKYGSSTAGLQLGLIRDSTISNNIISECGTATYGMAINCGGNNRNPVRNLTFTNNTLKNNYNKKYTFRIFGFENVSIDNLVSENNAGDGISIAESVSSKIVMRNSRISNNSGFGIKYSNLMKEVTIKNCEVIGNSRGASSLNGVTADKKLGSSAYLINNNGL